MIIVTGAAGFIGSNLIVSLNGRGHDDIIAVDDLTDGRKFRNLSDLAIADYLDKDAFRRAIADQASSAFGNVDAVFHQGACSETTEWNGKFMMDTNYEYSKEVFGWCQHIGAPMIYASSAAVYGETASFTETPQDEAP